ncbi:hypothetical protein SIO70_23350 [Chitinophaga sancti]|uniref:hypothetical protein n=1 Tax=Chitinophaga sancti TaxID=1004 RepID=UPI002A74AAD9|nr:hypothetical protein [Chitinophaga sancti]WPQ61298.1 hypothetical protein SIO70_23350 [Chitinophaga sancti]
MKYDQEYVYTLLLRKQLGGLSDPEEEWLEKVFQETCKGKGVIAEFYEGLGNYTNDMLDDLRVETQWAEVARMLKKRTFKERMADFIDQIRSRLFPLWIIRVIDRKLGIIKQTDPDKIFVGKIQQFFHIPIALARLFCEMAVQVGLYFTNKLKEPSKRKVGKTRTSAVVFEALK